MPTSTSTFHTPVRSTDPTFPAHRESFRAHLFATLLDLAVPIVEHYRSDLFHDAGWVREHVTGNPLVFWFGARSTGTNLGTDSRLVIEFNDHVWRIEVLSAEGGRASYTVTPVKAHGELLA
jgi:hypothetical protein